MRAAMDIMRRLGVGGIFAAILLVMMANAWFDSMLWVISFIIDAGTNIAVILLGLAGYRMLRDNAAAKLADKDAQIAALQARLIQRERVSSESDPIFRIPAIGARRVGG